MVPRYYGESFLLGIFSRIDNAVPLLRLALVVGCIERLIVAVDFHRSGSQKLISGDAGIEGSFLGCRKVAILPPGQLGSKKFYPCKKSDSCRYGWFLGARTLESSQAVSMPQRTTNSLPHRSNRKERWWKPTFGCKYIEACDGRKNLPV